MNSQQGIYDKAGLGYKPEINNKMFSNMCRIEKKNSAACLKYCKYCNFHGHSKEKCPIKLNRPYRVIKRWIRKQNSFTNSGGPNQTWGPKQDRIKFVVAGSMDREAKQRREHKLAPRQRLFQAYDGQPRSVLDSCSKS